MEQKEEKEQVEQEGLTRTSTLTDYGPDPELPSLSAPLRNLVQRKSKTGKAALSGPKPSTSREVVEDLRSWTEKANEMLECIEQMLEQSEAAKSIRTLWWGHS